MAALALAGSLASCAQSQRETGSTTEQGSGGGESFRLRGFLRSQGDGGPANGRDGETFRILGRCSRAW